MFKLLKKLNKKEITLIIISTLFIVLQVFLDLRIPDYMKDITEYIQKGQSSIKDILIPGSLMLLCALGSLASSIVVGYFGALVASSFAKDLRSEVFSKVEKFGMAEIKKFSISSLITRTTNDITQIQSIIAIGMQIIIKAPILAVWAILKIANKNFKWTFATIIAVVILLIFITLIILFVVPKFKKIQELVDKINLLIRENISGVRVVRAYNAVDYQNKKFNKTNKDFNKTNLFVQKVTSAINPGMTIIMSLLTLSIYYIGAQLINAAEIPNKLGLFSDMIVFSSYAMQVVMAFMMMAMIFIIYPRALVSSKRVLEVLNENSLIVDGNIDYSDEKGSVEFKNVSFKYPDAEEYMLKNINFSAKKGEVVAIIGSTGSGKSTLLNLIPRFYDATDGQILINGEDIKNYSQEYLHNIIGYIPQRAVMFLGTIKDNITYGMSNIKKIKDADIKEALRIAQADQFVNKMSNKYKAQIAQGGTNISGGQKQRIAIARALVRKPEFLLFDDSFSALDYKTDLALRQELTKIENKPTIVIVAQRIGTIMNADQILVIDQGEIVGKGKHEELMNNCSVYQEIAYSQLSKEELSNES